ncbi:NTP transferase domain-containing protein [Candidatus Daviesbacteria bacterium]|nr:NTP transferase domain-containing protein [Candidatus Daviesbacteria bacterium]
MSNYSKIAAIVLAAGKGTRMGSSIPKVLLQIGGKTLVTHTLDKLQVVGINHIYIVVGFQKNEVKKILDKKWNFIDQKKMLGTGDAVKKALRHIPKEVDKILVINSDDALFYQPKTLTEIIHRYLKSKAKMTILTSIQKGVDISGRVIRNEIGKIIEIKPNSQMSEEELKQNNEVVCGLYIFDRDWLEKELPKIKPGKKGEYNITSLIDIALQFNLLQDIILSNPDEWRSINTPREYKNAKNLWQKLYD